MTSYFQRNKLNFRPKVSSISPPFDSKKISDRDDYPRIVKTSYTSKPVEIPSEFLKATPADAQPITVERVDFAASAVPEYAPYYATVLDNVLSLSECTELLRLAELSSPTGDWGPAMINAGAGFEILATEVRRCDRIVWDEPEMVKRIWDRCLAAKGIKEELERIERQPAIQGEKAAKRGDKWRLVKVNERMRFLRYGPGNYFKSHHDGTYETPSGDLRSFYTLHLYLNDSVANGGDVQGGATTFHGAAGMSHRLDVDPKMGRVLIFQHAHLLHCGDEVQQGIKYTMRSDLMYERILDEEAPGHGASRHFK
jgi:hypothetical protein